MTIQTPTRSILNSLNAMEVGESLKVPEEVNLESLRVLFNEEQKALIAMFGEGNRRYLLIHTETRTVEISDRPARKNSYLDASVTELVQAIQEGKTVKVPVRAIHRVRYIAKKAGLTISQRRLKDGMIRVQRVEDKVRGLEIKFIIEDELGDTGNGNEQQDQTGD